MLEVRCCARLPVLSTAGDGRKSCRGGDGAQIGCAVAIIEFEQIDQSSELDHLTDRELDMAQAQRATPQIPALRFRDEEADTGGIDERCPSTIQNDMSRGAEFVERGLQHRTGNQVNVALDSEHDQAIEVRHFDTEIVDLHYYLGWRLLAGSGRTPLTQSMTTGRRQIKRLTVARSARCRTAYSLDISEHSVHRVR